MAFRLPRAVIFLLIFLFTSQNLIAAQPTDPLPDFGELPLSFVPTSVDSLTEAGVRFQVAGMGGALYFSPDNLVMVFPHEQGNTDSIAVQMQFEGANPESNIRGFGTLPGTVNYFNDPDPTRWKTDIPTYGGIDYDEIYPGIDVSYEGIDGRLKSTYLVSPEADPAQIRWRYSGTQSLEIDATTGDLHITLDDHSALIEQAPIAWQDIGGQRIPVDVSYRIVENETIGFNVGYYDLNYPLIIDPVLVYSSFFSTNESSGYAIQLDTDGNIYLTGSIYYPPPAFYFPIVNAFQPTHGGATCGSNGGSCPDAFVMKLNPTGNQVLFSTYLGGSGHDLAFDMAVDAAGNVVVAGVTRSINFPTVSAIFPTSIEQSCQGILCWGDGFVTKLSAAGNALIYSTYLGGTLTDSIDALAMDAAGNVFLTGYTYSTNFPVANALFPTSKGDTDLFVAKLNQTGSTLFFSTYLGGSLHEGQGDIAVDSNGNIYLSGRTSSTDFPVTPATAYQPVYGGGEYTLDAFIVKLAPLASSILYASYLGGPGSDSGDSIAVNETGVYVTGQADTGFPLTSGVYDSSHACCGMDIFVAKFDPNASGAASLVYSTYVGGASEDQPLGVRALEDGSVYVVGRTESADFPLASPIQSSPAKTGGESDGFIFRLNPAGKGLLFSTYLGGQRNDCDRFERVTSIAFDFAGNIYVTGDSASTCFQITSGAYLTSGRGLYLTKIGMSALDLEQTVSSTLVEAGETVTFTLNLTNKTSGTLNNIIVQDALPAGLTFLSSGANYNPSNSQWSIASLSAGQKATLTIDAFVEPGASGMPLTNMAQVVAYSPSSPYVGKDRASATISVGLDLAITKTVDNNTASSGDTIVYRLTAANNSAHTTAANVIVYDLLPGGVQFQSASASQGTYNAPEGVWSIGNLDAGMSATLDIVVLVGAGAPATTITNTAVIQGAQADAVTSNNTASAVITLTGCPPVNPIVRISRAYDGSSAAEASVYPSASENGRFVAYQSQDASLVVGDTNNLEDIFVYDRLTCQNQLISVSSSGYHANGYSNHPSISANGRYVAFRSAASSLTSDDTNEVADIFVRDLLLDQTTRVSIATSGAQANGDSDYPAISADGRYVIFLSSASNLVSGDTNGYRDVFVHDRQNATTKRLSISSAGTAANNHSDMPSISVDGRYVVFSSNASNLVPDDSNNQSDVFVYDQLLNTSRRVSLNSSGAQANGASDLPSISGDGRYIAFVSWASNFAGAISRAQIFVRDMKTGETSLVSSTQSGVIGNDVSTNPHISKDGRFVAFQSQSSNLVSGDTNGTSDIFIKDRLTGQLVIVSVNSAGVIGNLLSQLPSISPDGTYAAFTSDALNLVSQVSDAPLDNYLVKNPFAPTTILMTDLIISQTSSPEALQPLDEVILAITVTNQSAQDAHGVVIRSPLSAGLSYVGITPVSYTCNQNAGFLYCPIGTIPAGESVTVEVYAQISAGVIGELKNEVTVWADELDSDSWTNSNVHAIQINGPPSGVTATATHFNRIRINWLDKSADETNFRIERSSDGLSDWQEVGTADADAVSFFDTLLICETTYYYRARALLSDGRYTPYSAIVHAMTLMCPPLVVPENLIATAESYNQINLVWMDGSLDETDFRVERSLDGVNTWVEIGTTAGGETAFVDENVICGTTYDYRVRAHRSSNNAFSGYSTVASVETQACLPLAAPSDMTAVPANDQIDLNWVDNSIDETDFRIERSEDGINNWIELGQAAAEAASFEDAGRICGAPFYRVRAHRDGDGAFSEYSNLAQLDLSPCPLPPTNLQVDSTTFTEVSLSWTDNSVNEVGFRVERSDDGVNNWVEIVQTAEDEAHFVDMALTCGVRYYYRVYAYPTNGTQPSDYTNIMSATTQDCSATNAVPLQNYALTNTPTLAWNQVSWSLGYEVQVNNSSDFDGNYDYQIQTGVDVLSVLLPELPNGTYYWRVRAKINATEWGEWSIVETFVVISS